MVDWGSNMRTILEFVENLADGGAETLIKNYALLIDKTQFEIIIVTIYNTEDTANYQQLKNAGIRIITVFPKMNLYYKVVNHFFRKQYIKFIFKKVIRKENPDCVHIHMWILKYFDGLADCLENKSVYYTCHSLPERYFGQGQEKEFKAAKYLLKNTTFQIIALHEEMALEINNMFSIDDVIVLNNLVDTSRFQRELISKEASRKQLGIPVNSFVLGNVGRLSDVKNQEFLLKVFKLVHDINKDSFLVLVGNGPNKSDIIEYLSREKLLDYCLILEHRMDVPLIMKSMDVFLFPSKYEGLGIATIEAQVMGLKCIISDKVPQDVIVTDKVVKLGINDENLVEWRDAILGDCTFEIPVKTIDDYCSKNVIEKLQNIYSKKL